MVNFCVVNWKDQFVKRLVPLLVIAISPLPPLPQNCIDLILTVMLGSDTIGICDSYLIVSITPGVIVVVLWLPFLVYINCKKDNIDY
jgi:hypothetical protein